MTTMITSWSEHDLALDTVFGLAERSIRIFDADLSLLKLELPERIEKLRGFLTSGISHTLQIVVRNPDVLFRNNPRLIQLLTYHSHNMGIFSTPEHLANLNDNMLIADGRHALIRFHADHVRSKIIVNNPAECQPYEVRLNDIINEGCTPIGASPLGL